MKGRCVNNKENPDSCTAARPLCLPPFSSSSASPPSYHSQAFSQWRQRWRDTEAGRKREREGRRERVPTSTVNDIMGLFGVYSASLARCLYVTTCFCRRIDHTLFILFIILFIFFIIYKYFLVLGFVLHKQTLFSHFCSVFLLFSPFSPLSSINAAHSYWICNFHSLPFSHSLVVSLSVSEHHCHKSTAVWT